MTYEINGTEITLQPTTGRWIRRRSLGEDGAGHPIYPAIRQFELRWGVMTPSNYEQLQTFFETVVTTGTISATLPKYGDPTYTFYTYTGCVLDEPKPAEYFTEHITDVVLLIRNIHT